MGQLIAITAADGSSCSAYLAEPAGRPRGAVVVLQEIFGVNSHIRAVADGYAAEGYLALAPATFDRVKSGVELGYTDADMQAGFALKLAVEALPAPGVLADIQAAIDEAARRSGGKVGIVGYCWGGLLTWRSACGLQGLAAAVPYYGGGMTTPDEAARRPQCPVLAHFAEQELDSDGYGRGLPCRPARCRAAQLRRPPRLQLRPARRLAPAFGCTGARAHAGLLRPPSGLIFRLISGAAAGRS
ncbi:MAG: hypothetical protein RIS48_818 [Pseudomonadota bacterium]